MCIRDREYTATTDQPTVINLTNHSYFNLTGCKEPVLDHIYRINADSITPVDSTGIPTGEILAVAGTVYDYTTPQRAEKRIRKMGKGYDVNYKPVSYTHLIGHGESFMGGNLWRIEYLQGRYR